MSQKANPATIGLFIVIGLTLGVIGVITFSSGKLFRKQHRFVLYFDASLKGLNPGAPVKLRGVTIGSVVEVLITHNQATNDYSMPVIIDIDQELLQSRSDRLVQMDNQDLFAEQVKKGLRGKLDAESLVTGVLYVELQIVPYAPPPVFHQLTPEYPEIPTVPTTIQELISNLASFDIEGISDKLNALLTRLDTTLTELNVQQLNRGLTNLIASLDAVVSSPDLTNSLTGLRLTLQDARALVKKLDDRVDPIADSVTNTLAAAQLTLAEMRRGVAHLGGLVAPDAPLQSELTSALNELSNAARAVGDLAEFLQRHPLRRRVAAARLGRSLSTLLESGLPILPALEVAAESQADAAVAAEVLRAREEVRAGDRLAASLRRTGIFPFLFVQMVEVGEEGGRLPEMLDRGAAAMEGELERRLDRMLRLLEPLLIVVFGGIVGFVALSLLQAIYGIRADAF